MLHEHRGDLMKQFFRAFICSYVIISGYAHSADNVKELDNALSEYQNIQRSPDVGRLVVLDEKLRQLIDNIQKSDKEGVSGKMWKPEYEVLGIGVGHYSDSLFYTGKLLVEAHRLNPMSVYRERTLYAAIVGEQDSSGLGEMPDIAQATNYLREFPTGFYANKVNSILGTFYLDLYSVLKDLEEDPVGKKDYKYDCFSEYIRDTDYKEQVKRAKKKAISYLIKLSGSKQGWMSDGYKDDLEALRKNAKPLGSYWCAD